LQGRFDNAEAKNRKRDRPKPNEAYPYGELKGTDWMTLRLFRGVPTKKIAAAQRELQKEMSRFLDLLERCRAQIVFFGWRKRTRAEGLARGCPQISDELHRLAALGMYDVVHSEFLAPERRDRFLWLKDDHAHHARHQSCIIQHAITKPFDNRLLSEMPMAASSHASQLLQAADWIAMLVNRIYQYECYPHEFPEAQQYHTNFKPRVDHMMFPGSHIAIQA
jgi:hypothetical protein